MLLSHTWCADASRRVCVQMLCFFSLYYYFHYRYYYHHHKLQIRRADPISHPTASRPVSNLTPSSTTKASSAASDKSSAQKASAQSGPASAQQRPATSSRAPSSLEDTNSLSSSASTRLDMRRPRVTGRPSTWPRRLRPSFSPTLRSVRSRLRGSGLCRSRRLRMG